MSEPVGRWVSVTTPLGEARMYTARMQSAGRKPAILILHSLIGIDDYIKTMADQFANDGYLAAVPDLYSDDNAYRELEIEHIETAAHMSRDVAKRDLELARYDHKQRANLLKACEWIARRPNESYITIVRDVFRAMRSWPEVRDIGAIGFCMGGRLVGELAETAPELTAGVMHYGRPPKVESVEKIRSALQGHYASRDTAITEKVPAFAEAMAKAGKSFEHYIYEADHGFSLAPHVPVHDPAAARIALDRSRQFLRRHLKPQTALVEGAYR